MKRKLAPTGEQTLRQFVNALAQAKALGLPFWRAWAAAVLGVAELPDRRPRHGAASRRLQEHARVLSAALDDKKDFEEAYEQVGGGTAEAIERQLVELLELDSFLPSAA